MTALMSQVISPICFIIPAMQNIFMYFQHPQGNQTHSFLAQMLPNTSLTRVPYSHISILHIHAARTALCCHAKLSLDQNYASEHHCCSQSQTAMICKYTFALDQTQLEAATPCELCLLHHCLPVCMNIVYVTLSHKTY